jgi:4-amino-4-deoxy-L-arabinose transferase-like glycosyltransferase
MAAGVSPRLLLVLLVLALRLPFLTHPIQGDDAFYLAAAQQAQVAPADPHHFVITAQGMRIDMRGFPHPPGNSWILAAILAVTGEVREPVYHAVYLVFSVIAVLAAYSIARRYSGHALWAAMLFAATPAFVINGTSLETDLPFLAFWLGSMALYLGAVETGSSVGLCGAVAAMMAAAMISYQAVVMIPILAIHLWRERVREPKLWAAIWTPALAVAAWQLYSRASTGSAPAEILGGHFATHNLQSFANKMRNAAALTVHLGWMQSPLLSPWTWVAAPVAAIAAWWDSSPLFWAPFAMGVATLWTYRREVTLPHIWLFTYFAAALVIFFAGSARYLLPVALPLAILAVNRIGPRRGLLTAAFATHVALGLALAWSNRTLWELYREAASGASKEIAAHRSFVNASWGLGFYAESAGAIPMLTTQTLRGGDRVLSSSLGSPVRLPGGPRLVPLWERPVETPFRLIGLGSKSAYSSAAHGLRAFDIGGGPVDRVRLLAVSDVKPVLSYLPMNAAEADAQIVSGVYGLESNAWRWTARRAVVMVKQPDRPLPAEATFRIVDQMRNRAVTLSVDGVVVATQAYESAGQYTLRSAEPIRGEGAAATVTLEVAKAFRVDGDQRELGLILTGAGFRE